MLLKVFVTSIVAYIADAKTSDHIFENIPEGEVEARSVQKCEE